jgi:hypothetical protein
VGPRFLLRSLGHSLLPVFTGVRGIGILRTSPFGVSTKFALKEFSEVGQEFIGNSSPGASVVAAAKERRHKKCPMAGIPDRGNH